MPSLEEYSYYFLSWDHIAEINTWTIKQRENQSPERYYFRDEIRDLTKLSQLFWD